MIRGLSLTSAQLAELMAAAATLPVEKREMVLERVGALARTRRAGRVDDREFSEILQLALAGLCQQPKPPRDRMDIRCAEKSRRIGAHLRKVAY
jgi:hypothetical protein